MAITDKDFAAANARGRKMLRTTPHAVAVIAGHGVEGYRMALETIARTLAT